MNCRILRPLALVLFAFCLPARAELPAPVWPGKAWEQATPEAMGMDSAALTELVGHGGRAGMDSLVVTRHGKLVTEVYYAPFKAGMKHRVNSVTKAVVGSLAGVAIGQGLLGSADTPVLDFFEGRTVASLDARKKAMTLQHLLDMTSGLSWFEPLTEAPPESMLAMERSGDWQQYVLDRSMEKAPGAAFNYNSGNAHLVSAIVARKSGLPTQEFARRHLFEPLGITDFRWNRDPQGVAAGGFGLYLRTPDMARFGYLYLNHGQWNGAQVVPREWVDKVFRASVPMAPMTSWRYADFWWVLPDRKAYMAVGFQGQLIVVLPEQGVVAAATGRAGYPVDVVVDRLIGAVKSGEALPANPQALLSLQEKTAQAASEKPAPVADMPARAREISGKTFKLASNEWGWKEFTLNLTATPAPTYELVTFTGPGSSATRQVTRPIGMDGRFATGDAAEPVAVASRAKWMDDSTLLLTVRVPEEAWTFEYQLTFSGRLVDITRTDMFGRRQTTHAEMQP